MPKQIGDMTLYTVLELSKLLDVTEVTLRRYIKDGKLKATLMGGKYLISEETLRELMQNGEQTKPKAEANDSN